MSHFVRITIAWLSFHTFNWLIFWLCLGCNVSFNLKISVLVATVGSSQRRFDKFYYNIKNLIEKNSFGSIQNIVIYYGGGIANTGSHIFDLIQFLFGNISWVEGKKSLNLSNNLSDPNLNGIIRTKSSITCNLHSINLIRAFLLGVTIWI